MVMIFRIWKCFGKNRVDRENLTRRHNGTAIYITGDKKKIDLLRTRRQQVINTKCPILFAIRSLRRCEVSYLNAWNSFVFLSILNRVMIE